MNCTFCSVSHFNGRKFRRRPVDSVIRELSTISNRFILILDDNILGYNDKEWLTEFFKKIIESGIKKYYFAQASMKFGEDKSLVQLAHRAGVRLVLVGIESIDEENLKNYNKRLNVSYVIKNHYFRMLENIRKGGVAVLGCFILGSDQDRTESFFNTLEFIKNSHIDVVQISKPTPLPGTDFYKEQYSANRIIDRGYPDAWKNYKFTRMLFKPKNLSIDDVYEGIHYIKRIYYSLPETIKRLYFTLKDTRSISTTLVALLYDHTYKKSFKNSVIYKNYNMMQLRKKFENKE